MANIADFIEVNTDENFAKWASMIVCPEKFQVELQPDLKTVIIQEKDSQLATVRVEMSMFPFPYFYQWRNNKKCSYNVALLTVLNKMLQQSSYLNEISDGLKRITNHRCFSLASNENGYNKDLHTFIMVDSEFVSDFDISNPEVREFANKLHMQPNSEKAVGDGSLVISSNPIYNAVGYHFENGNYTSIFPNKSNLPARLKSFILPNSVKLDFPSNNVFIGGDENTMECLVVFVRPGKERHVSGEIWIEKSRFRNITFTQQKRVWYTETNIKTGDVLHPKDAVIKSPFGDDTSLNNAVSIECTERNPFYMRMNVSYSLNEARITSNTGLKGYSSVQDNIGTLAVQTLDEGYQQLKPDMVCGPSSLKGKVNQIRLAQAAFVARFIHDYEPGTLDSLNEELINQLADECPVGIWVDADGCEHECYYGLVHVAFTDPSVQYSKNSYMGFQFEMLKLAMIEYPKLANILMDSRNKDDLDVVKEIVYLEQSLIGNTPKGFPVKSHTLFNNYQDSKTIMVPRINSIEIIPTVNHLLEEKRPPFILLASNGKKIYVPSGKTLKSFESAGANGQWLYDILLVQLSRAFNNVRDLNGLEAAVKRYVLTIGNRKVLYPELLGLNMKQTTLYDHIRTVSVPTKNLLEAKRKIYGEYEDWKDRELYAIHVRNPSVWRNQLSICKVVDGGNVNTIGISHDVVIVQKSDNDRV